MTTAREFFTGLSERSIATPSTLALTGDDVSAALVMYPSPHGWEWPTSWWVDGRSCPLLYLARGPGMTLKIGLSSKPAQRTRDFSVGKGLSQVAQRLGVAPGTHRLLLIISKGSSTRERALLRLVASERVSGEWSHGPRSELLISALCSVAMRFDSLGKKAA